MQPLVETKIDPRNRLRRFLGAMTRLVNQGNATDATIAEKGVSLLAELVAKDDWLPQFCAQPSADRYRQYLLYCDPLERFSVVSFVWGPGQATPIHDHTVWGLIGMLRGAEIAKPFRLTAPGRPLEPGTPRRLESGEVDIVSPTHGDIHEVSNAFKDQSSISIHVYGGNIGGIRRHVFDRASSTTQEFISGYSNDVLPNIWDRSNEDSVS